MDRQQQIQLQNLGPKALKTYIQNGIIGGLILSPFYPLLALDAFYHTKDVNPFLLKTGIKMNSPFDYYSYFKKRDGTYRIWNCFWSGALATQVEFVIREVKNYYLIEILDFKDSAVPDPSTGKLPKISAKKAVRYMLASFGFDVLNSLIIAPFNTVWMRMMTDYEPVALYDHMVDCFCKVVEKDGFLGLFKPFGYTLLSRLIDSSFDAFYYYKNLQNNLSDDSSDLEKSWFFYGMECLKLLVLYPVDRLNYRNIIDQEPNLKVSFALYQGIWAINFFTGVEIAIKFYKTFIQ